MRNVDALEADLHARGLRITLQRQLIYSLLAAKPSHPTVEAVREAVLAVPPTGSLRTVYQALHDPEADGRDPSRAGGQRTPPGGPKPERYVHLCCTKCGRLHDVVGCTQYAVPAAEDTACLLTAEADLRTVEALTPTLSVSGRKHSEGDRDGRGVRRVSEVLRSPR